MANEKLLKDLKVGPKHSGGWYVRCQWMEPKSGKVQIYAGPFESEEDAIAFNVFNHPNGERHHRGWITELDDYAIRYYLDYAGEQRGVDEVKLLLPTECRLAKKGWKGVTDLKGAMEICRKIAKNYA